MPSQVISLPVETDVERAAKKQAAQRLQDAQDQRYLALRTPPPPPLTRDQSDDLMMAQRTPPEPKPPVIPPDVPTAKPQPLGRTPGSPVPVMSQGPLRAQRDPYGQNKPRGLGDLGFGDPFSEIGVGTLAGKLMQAGQAPFEILGQALDLPHRAFAAAGRIGNPDFLDPNTPAPSTAENVVSGQTPFSQAAAELGQRGVERPLLQQVALGLMAGKIPELGGMAAERVGGLEAPALLRPPKMAQAAQLPKAVERSLTSGVQKGKLAAKIIEEPVEDFAVRLRAAYDETLTEHNAARVAKGLEPQDPANAPVLSLKDVFKKLPGDEKTLGKKIYQLDASGLPEGLTLPASTGTRGGRAFNVITDEAAYAKADPTVKGQYTKTYYGIAMKPAKAEAAAALIPEEQALMAQRVSPVAKETRETGAAAPPAGAVSPPTAPVSAAAGVGFPPSPGGPPLVASSDNPIQQFLKLVGEAKPIREEQELGYTVERAKRASEAMKVPFTGEASHYEQLGRLAGPLPKMRFDPPGNAMAQEVKDKLLSIVENTTHPDFAGPNHYYDRLGPRNGLIELLLGNPPQRAQLRDLETIFNHESPGAGNSLIESVTSIGKTLPNEPWKPMPEFPGGWKEGPMFKAPIASQPSLMPEAPRPFTQLPRLSQGEEAARGITMQREIELQRESALHPQGHPLSQKGGMESAPGLWSPEARPLMPEVGPPPVKPRTFPDLNRLTPAEEAARRARGIDTTLYGKPGDRYPFYQDAGTPTRENPFGRMQEGIKGFPLDETKPLPGQAPLLQTDVAGRGAKPPPSGSLKASWDRYQVPPEARGGWAQTMDALGIPRALFAMADFSYPLRQGVIFAPAHPLTFGSEFKPMFKAAFSERHFGAMDVAMRSDPQFQLWIDSGGRYSDIGGLVKGEEAFATTFLKHVPGIGQIYRGSERSATMFINKFRFDLFKNTIKGWEGTGKTANDYQQLAKLFNRGTGYSTLGKLEQFAPILNAGFFSPRFLVSRLTLLASLISSSPAVRMEAAKSLGAFVGTGLGILTFAKLAGAGVEVDPRSSDFGQIRIGATRYNFWGGYQPLARYTAQIIANQRKTGRGRIEGKAEGMTRLGFAGNLTQSKLSPAAGFGTDILRGRTLQGDELTTEPSSIGKQAFQRLVPGTIQAIVDAAGEQGPFMGGAAGVASGFGGSVSSYHTTADLQEQAAKQLFGKSYVSTSNAERAKINAVPEIQQAVEQAQQKAPQENIKQKTSILMRQYQTVQARDENDFANKISYPLDQKDKRQAVQDFLTQRRNASASLFPADVSAWMKSNREMPPVDLIREEYWSAQAPLKQLNGQPDYAVRDQVKANALASADAAGIDRKEILARGHQFAKPEVQRVVDQYHADQETLRPYWEAEQHMSLTPREVALYQDYVASGADQPAMRHQYSDLPSIIKRVDREKMNLREQVLAIDDALVRQGYVSKPIEARRR